MTYCMCHFQMVSRTPYKSYKFLFLSFLISPCEVSRSLEKQMMSCEQWRQNRQRALTLVPFWSSQEGLSSALDYLSGLLKYAYSKMFSWSKLSLLWRLFCPNMDYWCKKFFLKCLISHLSHPFYHQRAGEWVGSNEVGGIEVDFCVIGEAPDRGEFFNKHTGIHYNERSVKNVLNHVGMHNCSEMFLVLCNHQTSKGCHGPTWQVVQYDRKIFGRW